MAAEWPGLVTCRRHDSSSFGIPADKNWLSAQLRPITLFDRREESVHVQVNDVPITQVLHKAHFKPTANGTRPLFVTS